MPDTIVVEREKRILATPERLLPLLSRLPEWQRWSPWEDLDPALTREYGGEPGAIGSTYRWKGNRKAGAGSMEITAVDRDGVGVHLMFTRPFRSDNRIRFVLEPQGEATRVVWRMESPKTFMSRFFNLDKLVGPDFEKGLTRLQRVAEAG